MHNSHHQCRVSLFFVSFLSFSFFFLILRLQCSNTTSFTSPLPSTMVMVYPPILWPASMALYTSFQHFILLQNDASFHRCPFSDFCLWVFISLLCFFIFHIWERSFCVFSSTLMSLNIILSGSWQKIVWLHLFLWLNSILLCMHAYHSFFFQSSVFGHFSCFQSLNIVNSVAMKRNSCVFSALCFWDLGLYYKEWDFGVVWKLNSWCVCVSV